jgi:predicted MPP superfamily phosphohydrolase
MKSVLVPIIFAIILFTIDWFAFKGFKELFKHRIERFWRIFVLLYWLPLVLLIVLSITMIIGAQTESGRPPQWLVTGMSWIFVIGMSKIAFAVFHLGNDLVNLLKRMYFRWFKDQSGNSGVTRSQFLNQVGLGASTLLFTSFVYGMVKGKFNFQVRYENLQLKGLPFGKRKLRIVQISDSHLGTFGEEGVDEVSEAIRLINELEPDFVFFTGDLVNNIAEEALPFVGLFASIEAKQGKYSILGNHDYAEYMYRGDSPAMKEKKRLNMIQLEEVHQKMGFQLLRNEHVIIGEEGDSKLAIIGVENWGRNFFQFGDLRKAMSGLPEGMNKILLSHDPTHFEEQVMGKENIFLTLSGHTHGAQFGVEIPDWGIKWSPSAWFGYKRWGGLYSEGKQNLYVNRGLGCLGFPGRVGIMPEITCIDLVD